MQVLVHPNPNIAKIIQTSRVGFLSLYSIFRKYVHILALTLFRENMAKYCMVATLWMKQIIIRWKAIIF